MGPLKRTEIPLDVLDMLISAGFEVNYSKCAETCLDLAIGYNHYKAVRWLVEHGAHNRPLYIRSLTSKPNVPLDLFDLLMMSESPRLQPLHQSLRFHHPDYALHLIKLATGADIDVIDPYVNGKRAIDHYRDTYFDEFHEELFLKLISHHSFTLVSEILKIVKDGRHKLEVMYKMVMYLLQYLNIPDLDAFSVGNSWYPDRQCFYMESLLVLLLDMDLVEMPDLSEMKSCMLTETLEQSIEDIWNAYNHRHGNVKSLITLCIHSVRNSLNNLDNYSFHSLPVPSRIRDLLMLRNVASILCEAGHIWPKRLCIEDIVKEAL